MPVAVIIRVMRTIVNISRMITSEVPIAITTGQVFQKITIHPSIRQHFLYQQALNLQIAQLQWSRGIIMASLFFLIILDRAMIIPFPIIKTLMVTTISMKITIQLKKFK